MLSPYPGCKLREKIISEGRLLKKEWKYYTGLDVTFKPKNMSPNMLQNELVRILKSIYNKEYLEQNIRYFKKIYKNL